MDFNSSGNTAQAAGPTPAPLGLGSAVQQHLAKLSGSTPDIGYHVGDDKGTWSGSTDVERVARRNPMFITTTWRSADPESDPETGRRLHLADGIWIDIDADSKKGQTIEDAVRCLRETAAELQNLGIHLECCSLFASGGKGFHVFVPADTFIAGGITKVGINTARYWPKTCKALVYNELVTDCTDLGIYNAGSGRLFRQPNVLRANGAYKVALNWTEYQDLTTDTYKVICAAPRPLLAPREVPAASLMAAIAWVKAFRQVTGAKKRATKTPAMKLDSRGRMFSADQRRVDRALSQLQGVDLSYANWLHVGMALQASGVSNGLELWDKFSRGCPKYRRDDCASRWEGFRSVGYSINLGTLFFLASNRGAA